MPNWFHLILMFVLILFVIYCYIYKILTPQRLQNLHFQGSPFFIIMTQEENIFCWIFWFCFVFWHFFLYIVCCWFLGICSFFGGVQFATHNCSYHLNIPQFPQYNPLHTADWSHSHFMCRWFVNLTDCRYIWMQITSFSFPVIY